MAHRTRANATGMRRAAGQSIWLDDINRAMLESGSLERHIEDLAVSGFTSNPTILGRAMSAAQTTTGRSSARLEAIESQDCATCSRIDQLIDTARGPTWPMTRPS